jgi:hypothetical protein
LKKPVIVRFFGWAFALWFLLAMLPWVGIIFNIPVFGVGFFAWFVYWIAGFCLAFWCIGTLVSWAIDRHGRQQAAIMQEALRFQIAPVAPAPSASVVWQAPTAQQPASYPTCAMCGGLIPQWWCHQHALALCQNCAGNHRGVNPQCQWATIAAPAPTRAERPRAVKTSPLGGLR